MTHWNDTRLKLLYDHYKDTFSINRGRERSRDILFYLVVLLFGVLLLELGHPDNFTSILTEFEFQGAKLHLSNIPYGTIISVTWTLILMTAMRYCQISTHIEKQYKYLHKIEEKICSIIGEDDVFSREGKSYFENYPLFSEWTWFFYTGIFPVIIIIAALFALHIEWNFLDMPLYHQLFDTVIGFVILTTFMLYRTIPQILKKISRAYF